MRRCVRANNRYSERHTSHVENAARVCCPEVTLPARREFGVRSLGYFRTVHKPEVLHVTVQTPARAPARPTYLGSLILSRFPLLSTPERCVVDFHTFTAENSPPHHRVERPASAPCFGVAVKAEPLSLESHTLLNRTPTRYPSPWEPSSAPRRDQWRRRVYP